MRHPQARWDDLFLIVAVVFGAIVRFAPTLLAHSTINDGGMLLAMIDGLRGNQFLLPLYTSYNHLNIPFAYPPLSLYAGALLSATGIPAGEVVRWLPAVVSSLSILAFQWMTVQIIGSRPKAALATLAYALMPRSFSWYVMGGGLSRSFGILFLLLACGAAWRLFTKPGWRRIALTAIFGAGAVLSHPETGLHALAACILIWIARGRSARSLRDAVWVALGVIVLASPWWVTVLAQHGLAPLQSALAAGGHSGLFWTPLVTMDFADERFVTLLTALGLVGFAVQCIRRDWFLPVWLMVPFLVEPRSAVAIAALPLAILAGIGLADFVIPKIASLGSKAASDEAEWTEYMSTSRAVKLVTGYVLISAFIGAFAFDLSLATYVVPASGREAMLWIESDTPTDGRFLVLTGTAGPFSDPSVEWFPEIARRTSENTVQGREWTLGSKFTPFVSSLPELQACLNSTPECLNAWARAQQAEFDYVYIQKPPAQDAPAPSGLLLFQLRKDPGYRLVFENTGAAIFRKQP